MGDDGAPSCGCKGIRFCAACETTDRVQKLKFEQERHISYDCYVWDAGKQVAVRAKSLDGNASLEEIQHNTHQLCSVPSGSEREDLEVDGLLLLHDFIDQAEEDFLMDKIDGVEWAQSQSGRRKQDYGPQVNFKHKKVKTSKFIGMPDYADMLLSRMSSASPRLTDYLPLEMCNLEYHEDRKSAIEMHRDDMWIWGNRLISINLLNGSVMTLVNDSLQKLVFVWMPHRSLLCMSDTARYEWKHGVVAHHIRARRIALTMREAADPFQEGGELFEKHGEELLRIARLRVPLGGNVPPALTTH